MLDRNAWTGINVHCEFFEDPNNAPQIFFTYTCAEYQWRRLLEIIEKQILDTEESVLLRSNRGAQ